MLINLRSKYLDEKYIRDISFRNIQEYYFYDLAGNYLYKRVLILFDNKLYRISKNLLNLPNCKNYRTRYICILSNINWHFTEGRVMYIISCSENLTIFTYFHIYKYVKDKYREFYQQTFLTYSFTDYKDIYSLPNKIWIKAIELQQVKEIIKNVFNSYKLLKNL